MFDLIAPVQALPPPPPAGLSCRGGL